MGPRANGVPLPGALDSGCPEYEKPHREEARQEKKMIQLNRQQILHINRNYRFLLVIFCS